MAVVEFTLTDDLAKQVAGFFAAGQEGRIIFTVSARRVLNVELSRVLDNAVAIRSYTPGASGVDLCLTHNGVRR